MVCAGAVRAIPQSAEHLRSGPKDGSSENPISSSNYPMRTRSHPAIRTCFATSCSRFPSIEPGAYVAWKSGPITTGSCITPRLGSIALERLARLDNRDPRARFCRGDVLKHLRHLYRQSQKAVLQPGDPVPARLQDIGFVHVPVEHRGEGTYQISSGPNIVATWAAPNSIISAAWGAWSQSGGPGRPRPRAFS